MSTHTTGPKRTERADQKGDANYQISVNVFFFYYYFFSVYSTFVYLNRSELNGTAQYRGTIVSCYQLEKPSEQAEKTFNSLLKFRAHSHARIVLTNPIQPTVSALPVRSFSFGFSLHQKKKNEGDFSYRSTPAQTYISTGQDKIMVAFKCRS